MALNTAVHVFPGCPLSSQYKCSTSTLLADPRGHSGSQPLRCVLSVKQLQARKVNQISSPQKQKVLQLYGSPALDAQQEAAEHKTGAERK